jgi:hypothetical protein
MRRAQIMGRVLKSRGSTKLVQTINFPICILELAGLDLCQPLTTRTDVFRDFFSCSRQMPHEYLEVGPRPLAFTYKYFRFVIHIRVTIDVIARCVF